LQSRNKKTMNSAFAALFHDALLREKKHSFVGRLKRKQNGGIVLRQLYIKLKQKCFSFRNIAVVHYLMHQRTQRSTECVQPFAGVAKVYSRSKRFAKHLYLLIFLFIKKNRQY
jgi:hypothetical protein